MKADSAPNWLKVLNYLNEFFFELYFEDALIWDGNGRRWDFLKPILLENCWGFKFLFKFLSILSWFLREF